MMARRALLPFRADRSLPPSILLIVARAAGSMNMVSIAIALMSLAVIGYVALLLLSAASAGGLFRKYPVQNPRVDPDSSSGFLTLLFLFCSICRCGGVPMERELVQLQRNINRIRREIRLQAAEMQALIDADLDCSAAALLLVRMQTDLVLFVEKRERLKSQVAA
jgi:hypothetical protein